MASAVAELAGHEHQPVVLTAGDVWADLVDAEWQQTATGCVLTAGNWEVMLVLPSGDVEAADAAGERWLPPLMTGLGGVGGVTRSERGELSTGDGSVPVWRIPLSTEEIS